jgi:tetratricopeptide (TPR) repeat protein
MSENKSRQAAIPQQPNLSSLLARYLQRQAEAHADGLAAADATGEVVPHEVGPVQPIDARPAWEEAVAVMTFYGPGEQKLLQPPPQWPHLVAAHEPETALPFCLGNFPQLVRNYQALMQTKNLLELRPTATGPVHADELVGWAKQDLAGKQMPRLLLALGTLRLAKQFDAADEIVRANEAGIPAEWRAAWGNEKAALAWQRGQFDNAQAIWQALPPSVPVLFNRGMAALFCGRPAEAQTALTDAVKQLPDSGAWHHLGQLYLTLLMNPS